MEYLAIIVLILCLAFIAKAIADALLDTILTKREKTNFICLICVLPVAGSCLFYIYRFHRRNQQKFRSFRDAHGRG